MNKCVLNQLTDRLCNIGDKLGFRNITSRTYGYISEIYITNNHALQIEVDWRENNLFMYVVYLKNHSLPNKNIIYRYDDGQWCRKYIEEVYKTKRPVVIDSSNRYSLDYLFTCFDFYEQLINSAPFILKNFDETGSLDNKEQSD